SAHLLTGLIERRGLEVAEAVGQEFFGFCCTGALTGGAHYYGNKPGIVAFGGGHQAVTRFIGMAGFQPVYRIVTEQQGIAVGLANIVVSEVLFSVQWVVGW